MFPTQIGAALETQVAVPSLLTAKGVQSRLLMRVGQAASSNSIRIYCCGRYGHMTSELKRKKKRKNNEADKTAIIGCCGGDGDKRTTERRNKNETRPVSQRFLHSL